MVFPDNLDSLFLVFYRMDGLVSFGFLGFRSFRSFFRITGRSFWFSLDKDLIGFLKDSRKKRKKLTDIGFLVLVFPDNGLLRISGYWTD